MDNADKGKMYEILFMHMIMSLTEAGMIQLGKMVNPLTEKTETNLGQAQGTIELLHMLKAKTGNNLSLQEQQVLEQSIVQLELNYAQEQELVKSSAEPTPATLLAAEERADLESGPSDTEKLPAEEEDGDENISPGKRPGMNN